MAGMFNGMNNINSFGAGGGVANAFNGTGNIFGGNQFGQGGTGFNQFGAGTNLFGQNNAFGANTFQRNFFQTRRTKQFDEEEEDEEIEEEIEDEIEEDDEEEETNDKAVNPFDSKNQFSNSNSTQFPRLKQNNLNNPFGNLFSQFNQQNEESSEEEEDDDDGEEEEPKPKLKPKTLPKLISVAPKPIPIPTQVAQAQPRQTPIPAPSPANARSSTVQTKKDSAIIDKKESTIKERKDDRDDDYRPRRVARKIKETIIYEDDDDDDDEEKLKRSSRRTRRSPKHDESSQTKSVLQHNQSQQNFVPGPVGNRDLRPTGGTGVDLPLAVPTTMKPSNEVNKPVVININPLMDKNQKQPKSAFEKKERVYLESHTYSRNPCQPPSARERYLKPICLPVCSDNSSNRQYLSRNRSYKMINEKPIKVSSSRLICVDTSTKKKYECVSKSSTQPIFYQKTVRQASPPPKPQIQQQPEPIERIFKAAISSSMTTPPLPRLIQRRERINQVPVVKTGSPTFITIPQVHNIYNPISQSISSKELAAETAARVDTSSPVQIFTAPAGSQFSQNYVEKRSDTELSMGSVLSNLAPGRLPQNVYAKSPLAKSTTVQVFNERTVTGSSIASILSALSPGRIPDSLYFPQTVQQLEQEEVQQQEEQYAVVSDMAAAAISESSTDSETRLLAATPIQQYKIGDSELAIVKSSQQTATGSSIASILSALAPGRVPDSLFFKSPSSKIVNKPIGFPKTNSRLVLPTVKCQPSPLLTKDFCTMVNAALAKIPLNAPVHCYARAIESILNSSIFGNKYCNTKYRFEISPFTYSTDSTSRASKSSKQSGILQTLSSSKTLSNATLSIRDSKNLIIDAPPDLSMISIKIENI